MAMNIHYRDNLVALCALMGMHRLTSKYQGLAAGAEVFRLFEEPPKVGIVADLRVEPLYSTLVWWHARDGSHKIIFSNEPHDVAYTKLKRKYQQWKETT